MPLTDRQNAIVGALEAVDHNNPNLWNEDGTIRPETVQLALTDDSVTADEIADVAPGYKRQPSETREIPEGATGILDLGKIDMKVGPAAATPGSGTGVINPGDTTDAEGQDGIEDAPVEPAAPSLTPAQVKLKNARDVRNDRICEALGRMNHADKREWCEDGRPNAIIVSKYMGSYVAHDEIRIAAPSFRRQAPSPGELRDALGERKLGLPQEENNVDDAGRQSVDMTQITPEAVDEMRQALAYTRQLISEEEQVRDVAINRIRDLNAEADELLTALTPFASASHADTVKNYQLRSRQAVERNVQQTRDVQAALGLRPTDPNASALDAAMRFRARPRRILPNVTNTAPVAA